MNSSDGRVSNTTSGMWLTRLWPIAFIVLLCSLWGYANGSAIGWLASTVESASVVNLGLALGVVGIAALSLWRDRPISSLRQQLHRIPQWRWLPLGVGLGALVLSIALRSWTDIPQLEVALFVLGSYGLLGLYLKPMAWQQGLTSAVLIACLLPFSTQFQTGLGTPARVMTAHLVEQGMHFWRFAAVSANDIIVLENGIAHVDLPCSGLKSLWTGGVFLLLVTWLERRQLGLKWLLAASATLFALFWANAIRVFLLVLIAYGLNARQMAEILHVPLGLIGFCLSCGLGWLLLQWVPKRESARSSVQSSRLDSGSSHRRDFNGAEKPSFKHQWQLGQWQLGLVAILAVLAVTNNRIAPPLPTTALSTVQLPVELHAESLPLSQVETRFFQHSTFPIAEKWRFDWNGLQGSMLVVASHNWQAHHPPELCFAGNGFGVDSMQQQQLDDDLEARWLSLDNGTLSAAYWFQSPQGTTDEFVTRFRESILHRHTPWTMVSILFDRSLDPTDEQVREMTAAVQTAVDGSFIRSASS